ncbi:ankyrin repeat domain-containing protein 50-like [Ptychodera flava]|uniref:ankyrin repeat domain-containing protein 50-like n=1 Tax=Ptychodera flava TaxID=63121 RepID=UPI00396A813F
MAQQCMLQGKRFYCREWAFQKLLHCLESRPTSKTCGTLVMGGPGSGKTALCSEIIWATSNHGKQRTLSRRALAYHFCQAHDSETLSVSNFILGLVNQLSRSTLVHGYEDKISDPSIQAVLEPSECERNPDEAFKKGVLLPLLALNPPARYCFILVDSIDEGYTEQTGDHRSSSGGSRTIAELLANNHELFPPWLLLVCTARRQSKNVTRMFTGFRKISLDDLRKSHVVRDVQQYILSRLDREETLRQHLSRETAEMLNQLHIKSNGCFMYLEKVLDGVAEKFVSLRDISEIPGTLNGLYLWLCQRLFIRKQFVKIQPILNAMLAAKRPLTESELYSASRTRNTTLTREEFSRRLEMMSKILVKSQDNNTRIIFHHSFAEWLLDVKHCTQKYLCSVPDGHAMLAMKYTCNAAELTPLQVQDFAEHLVQSNLCPPLEQYHLSLWLNWIGTPLQDALITSTPKNQNVMRLLVEAGAKVVSLDENAIALKEALEKEESIRDLLDNGAMINNKDSNGRTLLANAAYCGNVNVVKLLLNRSADVEQVDKTGQTPLNLAARQGHTEVVNLLVEHSSKVDHKDKDGWTALRSAAWAGHTDVVVALLKAGADVDALDSDQRTALRAAAWGGHDDIVLSLLEHGASVNKADKEGRTALIAAAYMGHSQIAEHLLDFGAEINHQDSDGRTALSVASLCVPASKGHSEVVSILIEREAEVDHQDNDGMTPLLVAAYEGHQEVVELLLEGEADVDASDNNGRTPLIAAASMGHAPVVNTLLFWGAAIDTIDAEGRTVISIAAAQGNCEVVRMLLDRGLDEMHRDNAGWTPLHMASLEGHRDACEVLLEQGARVNEVDNDGRIPLILAAQEGHLEVVKLMLDFGARIDHVAHDGRNALRTAAMEGHKEVVHHLICKSSNMNFKDGEGRTTLYMLALENRVKMAEYLLENDAYVECTDVEGRTPLHVAAWQGNTDMVDLLVRYHAKVNSTDNDKRTALQSAAWQGHADIVKLLLERGASVDHTCNQGATALCIAAQEGHVEVLHALLTHGADPNHADQFGRTAMRVAIKGSHDGVIKLLENWGVSNPLRSGSVRSSEARCSSASMTTASTNSMPSNSIQTNGGGMMSSSSSSSSPDSTVDNRKSMMSNQSKSSSNLTSTSTNLSSFTFPPPPTEAPPGLSFTEQIQQHTMAQTLMEPSVIQENSRPSPPKNLFLRSNTLPERGNIPVSGMTSNQHASKPESLKRRETSAPSQQPPSTQQQAPQQRLQKLPSPEHKPRNMIQLGSHCNPEHLSLGRKGSLPISLQEAHMQHVLKAKQCMSPESKLRRNGIVTNPNYTNMNIHGSGILSKNAIVSNQRDVINKHSLINGNPDSTSSIEYKQAVKLNFEGSTGRNGIKKETPL